MLLVMQTKDMSHCQRRPEDAKIVELDALSQLRTAQFLCNSLLARLPTHYSSFPDGILASLQRVLQCHCAMIPASTLMFGIDVGSFCYLL